MCIVVLLPNLLKYTSDLLQNSSVTSDNQTRIVLSSDYEIDYEIVYAAILSTDEYASLQSILERY